MVTDCITDFFKYIVYLLILLQAMWNQIETTVPISIQFTEGSTTTDMLSCCVLVSKESMAFFFCFSMQKWDSCFMLFDQESQELKAKEQ